MHYNIFNLTGITGPLTGSGATAPVKLFTEYGVSLTANVVGNTTGTLKLQVCDDIVPGTGQLGTGVGFGVQALTGSSSPLVNWNDVTAPVSSLAFVSGGMSVTWNYPNVMAGWLRVYYTAQASGISPAPSITVTGISKG